jgi:hypothetical protein
MIAAALPLLLALAPGAADLRFAASVEAQVAAWAGGDPRLRERALGRVAAAALPCLGSPRHAERELASAALDGLPEGAALRAAWWALGSPDPEVRSRALALLLDRLRPLAPCPHCAHSPGSCGASRYKAPDCCGEYRGNEPPPCGRCGGSAVDRDALPGGG